MRVQERVPEQGRVLVQERVRVQVPEQEQEQELVQGLVRVQVQVPEQGLVRVQVQVQGLVRGQGREQVQALVQEPVSSAATTQLPWNWTTDRGRSTSPPTTLVFRRFPVRTSLARTRWARTRSSSG